MNKLKFNSETIQREVSDLIEESLSKLREASYICQDIYIPRGFAHYSYLINLRRNIESITTDLKSIDDWIDKSCLKLNSAISEINLSIEKIQDIQFHKNENFIKK